MKVNAAADSEVESHLLWRLSCLCLLFLVRAETHQAECPGFSALVSYTPHSYSSSRSGTPWSLDTADWQEKKVQMKVQSKDFFPYSETEISVLTVYLARTAWPRCRSSGWELVFPGYSRSRCDVSRRGDLWMKTHTWEVNNGACVHVYAEVLLKYLVRRARWPASARTPLHISAACAACNGNSS